MKKIILNVDYPSFLKADLLSSQHMLGFVNRPDFCAPIILKAFMVFAKILSIIIPRSLVSPMAEYMG